MDKFAEWSRDLDFPYSELRDRLEFLEPRLLDDYDPAKGEARFSRRLSEWLDGAGSDNEQRELFALLEYVYFVGEDELSVLYRESFNAQVMWWLSADYPSLGDAGHQDYIDKEVEATWFCPVTDSMNIARFHHLNRISGKSLRPEWRTLAALGAPDKVSAYMARKKLTRLILLEDFVGSGNQITSALEFAVTVGDELKILVAPMIICSEGFRRVRDIVAPFEDRVTLAPALVLPVDCVLSYEPRAGEPVQFEQLRELLRRLDPIVGGESVDLEERVFGFGRVGSLAVMHTNCPNNSPSALHFRSPTWAPLFPRASRH